MCSCVVGGDRFLSMGSAMAKSYLLCRVLVRLQYHGLSLWLPEGQMLHSQAPPAVGGPRSQRCLLDAHSRAILTVFARRLHWCIIMVSLLVRLLFYLIFYYVLRPYDKVKVELVVLGKPKFADAVAGDRVQILQKRWAHVILLMVSGISRRCMCLHEFQ